MKRVSILLLTFVFLLSSCNVEDSLLFLSEASQEEVGAFLIEKETSIRNEYKSWNGNSISFDCSLEKTMNVIDKLSTEVSIEVGGTFVIDSEKECFFSETLILRVKQLDMLSISCGGYISQDDTVYYDFYKIRGTLLSSQHNNFSIKIRMH